jgi:hypothetical protein
MPIDLTKHPVELQAAAIVAAATLTAAQRFGAGAAPIGQTQISVEEEVAQRAGAILAHLAEMPWELR